MVQSVLTVGVLTASTLTVGVMTVGVMTAGVMTAGVMTVGTMTAGVSMHCCTFKHVSDRLACASLSSRLVRASLECTCSVACAFR